MKIASDNNKPKLERQSMQWILNNTKDLTRYDVIYVLAIWAGFNGDDAFRLAYSSQYVDD